MVRACIWIADSLQRRILANPEKRTTSTHGILAILTISSSPLGQPKPSCLYTSIGSTLDRVHVHVVLTLDAL